MNRFSEKCADLGTENGPFIYPILGKTGISLRKDLLFLMFIESYLYAKKSEKK